MVDTTQDRLGPTDLDEPFIPTGAMLAPRSGASVPPDDRWYNLALTYQDEKGNARRGYAAFVGLNAATSFWDYICASSTDPSDEYVARFTRVSDDDGRMNLKMQDGNYLSCRAAPRLWVYRSSQYPISWEVVDGKLFTGYHAGAVGAEHRSFLVSDAYYLAVDTTPALTDCEWVLSPQQ